MRYGIGSSKRTLKSRYKMRAKTLCFCSIDLPIALVFIQAELKPLYGKEVKRERGPEIVSYLVGYKFTLPV
jgi:hypothetical protein